MPSFDLLTQYDNEVKSTRRLLECVPEDNWGWKPHAKSMSLGQLSGHVADLPSFLAIMVTTDAMELTQSEFKPFHPTSRVELLAKFDENAAATRKLLAAASDEHLAKSWKCTYKGQPVMDGPRHELLPMTLSHLIHHRGQLTVYLRLNDARFPGMYGPSADDMSAFA